ncbi:hypothetical protein Nepgr_006029 [Nepenthes gracilis]|uniref:Uncharacterized protein n=1 Tax=Nepenthes gracilis TaxID=150966 RepID=A0AAD3S4T2_NEPGR|nr:hypothetical protein Nepgr_006029 [Nepenthes gracilis]
MELDWLQSADTSNMVYMYVLGEDDPGANHKQFCQGTCLRGYSRDDFVFHMCGSPRQG